MYRIIVQSIDVPAFCVHTTRAAEPKVLYRIEPTLVPMLRRWRAKLVSSQRRCWELAGEQVAAAEFQVLEMSCYLARHHKQTHQIRSIHLSAYAKQQFCLTSEVIQVNEMDEIWGEPSRIQCVYQM